jgi:phosphotriesterase-related protein
MKRIPARPGSTSPTDRQAGRCDRRTFLKAAVPMLAARSGLRRPAAMTVRGPVEPGELGVTLMHEHVLVDFIGAEAVSRERYDVEQVVRVALPHLLDVKRRGAKTLVECTPAYLARDPALMRRLSEETGLQILTNTGYYGAAGDKFVPAHAYRESADELAARWVREANDGIDGTGIRPGFQKIGVDRGPLSEIDRKLIVAAARCHLASGLGIAVHTGDGAAAQDILATLRREGVAPSAYIWVHAQNERDRSLHVQAAAAGAFVEFDGIGPGTLDAHVASVGELIQAGLGRQVLVSQDAGWYHVGEPGGGNYRGYTLLFDAFLPALRRSGVNEAQVHELLVENPARALAIGVRRA